MDHGVERFVFLSSVGVYGRLPLGISVDEQFPCRPHEPYAIAKLAAERELKTLFQASGTELVVIRPAMIYGERCPGNFARLTKMVRTGLPLPLAAVSGSRTLLSIDNLVDLLVLVCAQDRKAAGVYNAADTERVELPDVIQAISEGLRRPKRNIAVPLSLLRRGLGMIGKAALVDKLAESVCLDSEKARKQFGWHPRVDSISGMRVSAASFTKNTLQNCSRTA